MKKIFKKQTLVSALIVLLIAGALGTAGYFYTQYQQLKKNPNMAAQQEVKTVTERIKRFMELPGDEEPTLATVSDKEKLKDQEFFKNAQNGDKILIYTKARKAILYRPSSGRVIEFAPLILGATENDGATPSGESQTQAEPVKVAIYNGTKTSGLSGEYEKKLAGTQGITVTAKANATKSDYTKTVVIDLSGKHKDLATQISQTVGGEVSDKLPDGETKPQADILIIAGK